MAVSMKGDSGPTHPIEAALRWLAAGVPGRSAVALVRHGLVENPQGLRYGRLPGFHLSAAGRAQAQALAAAFEGVRPHARLVRCSPLERAVETAEPIATMLGLPVTMDERLIESWSALDGQSRRAWIQPSQWPLLLKPWRPSWAEPFAEVIARTNAALREAEAQARGGLAVLVSHQSPIWLCTLAASSRRSWARHLPPWLRRPLRCETGTATILLFQDGQLVEALPPWRPVGAVGRGGRG